MSGSALSENWYRIARARPRLRAHARIHRQRHRGQIWYVMQDDQSGRFFRISPGANLMICLMDGRRTVEDIWTLAGKRYGPERPTRDEVAKLLAQLHNADLIAGELAPDMGELNRRAARNRRRDLLTQLRSPLAIRLPLFDPDRVLDATMPPVRPIFTRLGLALWTLLVAAAAVLAAQHGRELSADGFDRILATKNVALMLATYPIIKSAHELAHAYAVKAWSGEVHEMGVMMLVFLPVPYVDASSSSADPDPLRRALVGAAGIMAELALAALALFAWLNVGPGLVRAALFNVMLIGGVSTLLFNGNPLLRFDGYYVLADLIEIPNLDARSRKYLLYLVQRYGLGIADSESPAQEPGERAWFIGYGVASFVYRLLLLFTISLVVATKVLVVGAAIAIWSVVQMFVAPAVRAALFLVSDPKLRRGRRRALGFAVIAAAALVAALFVAPTPYAVFAEGVVKAPDDDAVRVEADGFAQEVLAEPGARVVFGQPVLSLRDPILSAQVGVKRAALEAMRTRFTAVDLIDLVQSKLVEAQLRSAAADLANAETRERGLVARAPHDGVIAIPEARKLVGRYFRRGDLVGYASESGAVTVAAVVPQDAIDLVRGRLRGVTVRLTEDLDHPYPARVFAETPTALDRAPAAALTAEGGGPMLLDPADPERRRPLEKFYEIDLRLDGARLQRIGGRAFARFDLSAEPVAWRILRAARQLFLQAAHV
jgi:putative peptide zinc metalloprotease protein